MLVASGISRTLLKIHSPCSSSPSVRHAFPKNLRPARPADRLGAEGDGQETGEGRKGEDAGEATSRGHASAALKSSHCPHPDTPARSVVAWTVTRCSRNRLRSRAFGLRSSIGVVMSVLGASKIGGLRRPVAG